MLPGLEVRTLTLGYIFKSVHFFLFVFWADFVSSLPGSPVCDLSHELEDRLKSSYPFLFEGYTYFHPLQ
jgi:hypothetical protein